MCSKLIFNIILVLCLKGIKIRSKKIKKIILDFIHEETGYANPLQLRVSFEDLWILSKKKVDENKHHVLIKYQFDEDGFSMYDKRHILEGEFTLDETGKILDWKLEETRTGEAANLDPYKTKTS
ncbi:MAG: hypothetical protein FK733_08185 [Asgard group archaeon]|nr:hypothetical protein [Asgard group archaeon]